MYFAIFGAFKDNLVISIEQNSVEKQLNNSKTRGDRILFYL